MAIEIRFRFARFHPERGVFGHEEIPFTNDERFKLRKLVAELLSNNGYGAIIEREGGMFDNEFASPRLDLDFVEDIEIEYVLELPVNNGAPILHGNLSTLFTSIPNFLQRIREEFPTTQAHVFTDMYLL